MEPSSPGSSREPIVIKDESLESDQGEEEGQRSGGVSQTVQRLSWRLRIIIETLGLTAEECFAPHCDRCRELGLPLHSLLEEPLAIPDREMARLRRQIQNQSDAENGEELFRLLDSIHRDIGNAVAVTGGGPARRLPRQRRGRRRQERSGRYRLTVSCIDPCLTSMVGPGGTGEWIAVGPRQQSTRGRRTRRTRFSLSHSLSSLHTLLSPRGAPPCTFVMSCSLCYRSGRFLLGDVPRAEHHRPSTRRRRGGAPCPPRSGAHRQQWEACRCGCQSVPHLPR